MTITTFMKWLEIRENQNQSGEKFQQDFKKNIDQQMGANKDAIGKTDPKVVINKAAIAAAQENPGAATDALNQSNKPGNMNNVNMKKQKKTQKKK